MKILLLLFIFVLLSGCNSNEIAETSAIISIEGRPLRESIIYEIKTDNTLRAIQENAIFDILEKKIIYGNDVKEKEKKLNSKEMKFVNKLLLDISSKEEDIIHPTHDAVEVYACIDNKIYYTLFYEDKQTNKDLFDLTSFFEAKMSR